MAVRVLREQAEVLREKRNKRIMRIFLAILFLLEIFNGAMLLSRHWTRRTEINIIWQAVAPRPPMNQT